MRWPHLSATSANGPGRTRHVQASELMPSISSIDYLLARTMALQIVIESLLSEHENPETVRRVSDQLFGQLQAFSAVAGVASPELHALVRQVIDEIFSKTQDS